MNGRYEGPDRMTKRAAFGYGNDQVVDGRKELMERELAAK
jgi:hypothetical protein